MARLISDPALIRAEGNLPKVIEEFFGLVNTGDTHVSIARMRSPQGWVEPGQTPEFSEYTLVLSGRLRVDTKARALDVEAGQAVVVHAGEWVRYSSPYEDCEYVSVCIPAFSAETVRRDASSRDIGNPETFPPRST